LISEATTLKLIIKSIKRIVIQGSMLFEDILIKDLIGDISEEYKR